MPFTYTKGIPAADNNPSTDQPNMRVNTDSISDLIAVDHLTFGTGPDGKHNKSSYIIQGTDPGSIADELVQYAKTSGANSELFFQRDGTVTPIQLTKGDVAATGGLATGQKGKTFLPGGLILQWGTILAGATTSGNFTFTSVFTSIFSFSACPHGNVNQSFHVFGLTTSGGSMKTTSIPNHVMTYMAIGT